MGHRMANGHSHADSTADRLDEPLISRDDLDSVETRRLDMHERQRVRLLVLLVLVVQTLALVLVFSAGDDLLQWKAFSVREHTTDVLIFVVINAVVVLPGSLIALLERLQSFAHKLNFVGYWLTYCLTILSMGKLVAFDWGSANGWRPYAVLTGWLAYGVFSISVLDNLQYWLHERSLWADTVCFGAVNGQDDAAIEVEAGHASSFNANHGYHRVKQVVKSSPKNGKKDEEKKKGGWLSKGFFRVLKPYFWPKGLVNKFRCFLTWVLLGLSKAANLISPIFIGRAVQELSDNGILESKVYMNIVIYAGLVLSSKVLKEMQNIVYLQVKQIAYVEVAEETFAHLHALSLEWHLKKKMGNVLRSMDRGVDAANTLVTYLFLYLVPSITECVVVFIIFYSHFSIPTLSATAFVSFLAYATLTVQITLWRKKFRTLTNKHDNDYHDKATDSLINYETVKYFTAESFEIQRYIDSVSKYQKYSTSTAYSLSFLNSTQALVIQSCTAICLCIAANEVRKSGPDGSFKTGDFVSVSAYIANLFAPLSFLGSVYNAVIQALVDMGNLGDLLKEKPDLVDAPGAKELVPVPPDMSGASIEFKDIIFQYPTAATNSGLKGLSFKVEPGTTTAIVGATGAGKSTISRLLFRFYDPLAGKVLISNQDIKGVTQQSLRRAIGVVAQDCVLFNDTVLHNIRYGRPGATMDEIEKVCEQAQILDFIKALPEGFETVVGERGLRLSGGEKQRVAIARCLIKDPPIVLLDEATSALDSVTERSVQSALNGLARQRTSLVIAHRLTTIADADQIIVLDNGQIKERGTHKDLLALQGAYAELWNSRLEEQRQAEKSLEN